MDQELFQTLTDIKVELARLNEKLDGYKKTLEDHEARIRKVERLVWAFSTAAAVGGGAVGSLVQQFLGA